MVSSFFDTAIQYPRIFVLFLRQ